VQGLAGKNIAPRCNEGAFPPGISGLKIKGVYFPQRFQPYGFFILHSTFSILPSPPGTDSASKMFWMTVYRNSTSTGSPGRKSAAFSGESFKHLEFSRAAGGSPFFPSLGGGGIPCGWRLRAA